MELVVSGRANPFIYVAPGWILLADPFGAHLCCDRLSDHTGYLKVEEILTRVVLLDPVDGSRFGGSRRSILLSLNTVDRPLDGSHWWSPLLDPIGRSSYWIQLVESVLWITLGIILWTTIMRPYPVVLKLSMLVHPVRQVRQLWMS